MSVSYNSSIVTSGLVMCLDAGNPRSYAGSGTTVADISGSGNNGTLTNGVGFVSSGTASYFNFDGIDDFINLPINSSFNTPSISFEVWCRLSNRNDRHIVMVNWAGNALEVNTDRSVSMYNWSSGGQLGATTSSSAISWDTWVHLVGTYDNAAQTLYTYINGSLSATRGSTPSTSYGVSVHKISGTDYGGQILGRLSIGRHYNFALSSSQVLQNFEATRGRYGI